MVQAINESENPMWLKRAIVYADRYDNTMQRNTISGFLGLFFGFLLEAPAIPLDAENLSSGPPLPVVTNVMQFNRLANQSQRATGAIHLEGVVRWVAPDNRLAVLEDDSGAAIVETGPFQTDATAGPGD